MIATGKGLLCPSCGGDQLEVRDSRPGPDLIRRRRQCPCGAPRVSTIEMIVGNARGAKSRTVSEAALSLLSLSSTRRVLVFQLIRQLGGLVDDAQPTTQSDIPAESGFSTVSAERIAETLHEHNRIQQTAQCLAALHQVPKDRPEFMHWRDLPEDYRAYVRAIAESIKHALDHPDTPVLQVVLRGNADETDVEPALQAQEEQ